MKLLIVSTKFGLYGGVERYILNSSLMLKRAGYRLYGFFRERTAESAPFEELFESYLICGAGELGPGLQEVNRWRCKTALLHKCEELELLDRLVGGYRLISFIHDHDYYCPRRHKYFPIGRINCPLPYNRAYCSLCSLADRRRPNFSRILNLLKGGYRFIVLSDHMRENLLMNGFPGERIIKVSPFYKLSPRIELNEERGSGPARLLFVGQLIRGKGCDLLLRALYHLKDDFVLNIVGEGKDMDYLKGLACRFGFRERVRFVGFTNEIGRYYRESEIVIFPSRWQEPFGLVGLEAMNYGKPVVGFDIGGVKEWLKDGENGCLAPAGNIGELARAIGRLIGDPQLAIRLGRRGRELVEERTLEIMCPGTLKSIGIQEYRKAGGAGTRIEE